MDDKPGLVEQVDGDDSHSQFTLLKSRRFLPFFLTQFCGALNDNLFKSTLLVILVSTGIAGVGADTAAQTNLLVNLAAGLFIMPFFRRWPDSSPTNMKNLRLFAV